MTDRLWCPKCEREGYHFDHSDEPPTCSSFDCNGELVEPPARVKAIWKLKQAIALLLFAGIFIGPIVWVGINIGKKPLWATKTVEITTTQPYGIIPDVLPFILLWMIIWTLAWGLRGGFPKP